jgi:hypothetical protein
MLVTFPIGSNGKEKLRQKESPLTEICLLPFQDSTFEEEILPLIISRDMVTEN